ncbi:MAG: hypothetical protein EYC70_09005 [Planctomycetota bacterium]|nr:MAG: hypothetical protein EYC70_09005 [Planctomycetota bacterium]
MTTPLLLALALLPEQAPRRAASEAIERAAVPRDGQQSQRARAFVLDDTGRARVVDPSLARPVLDPRSVLVIHSGKPPERRREPDGEHVLLPFRLQVGRADGTVDDMQPDLFPQTDKLQFDAAAQCFRGSVNVRLLATGAARDLAEPVTLFFRSTGSKAAVPAQLEFTRTNTSKVVVLEDSGAHDAVQLGVAVLGDPEAGDPPEALTLPLDRLRLELRAPRRMLGFGLQEETVSVHSLGVLPPGSFTVDLSADQGRIAPATVALKGAESATASLRSAGLGRGKVSAGSVLFADTTADVEYVLPVLFVGAALLGGGVGAVVQSLRRRSGKLRGRDVALGLASGVLAAVAYAAGVNLIGFDFGAHMHEAVVFTIAALATLVGLPVLERLRGAPAAPNP